MPIQYYICTGLDPNKGLIIALHSLNRLKILLTVVNFFVGLPYLEKDRKSNNGDVAAMSLIIIHYCFVSLWVTWKKVSLHKTARGKVTPTVWLTTRQRFEVQDEPDSHQKSLEIILLVGKMAAFVTFIFIIHQFNEMKPEDLMEYPGKAYCLIIQFGAAPTIWGIIVGVRFWRSQSLRSYFTRNNWLKQKKIRFETRMKQCEF